MQLRSYSGTLKMVLEAPCIAFSFEPFEGIGHIGHHGRGLAGICSDRDDDVLTKNEI